jgi:hypothetical protein
MSTLVAPSRRPTTPKGNYVKFSAIQATGFYPIQAVPTTASDNVLRAPSMVFRWSRFKAGPSKSENSRNAMTFVKGLLT